MPDHPSDPGQFQDVLGVADRIRVFFNGMKLFALLLLVYICAQLLGLAKIESVDFINRQAYLFSIVVDTVLLGFILATILTVQKLRSDQPDASKAYRLITYSVAVFLLASLIQIHLVGSQNSLHYLLIVAVLLVAMWFLKWREVVLFFILGNLGLAALIALEATGVLTYAPLFSRHLELTEIFLDWRVVLGQTLNYIFVLIACLALVWKLRRAMETSEALRNRTHQALLSEIEIRQQSEKEKERLIQELKASLEQVQTLRGLLPICSKCKKIRNDKGYWEKLEHYIQKHSPGVNFTHGLCPDCVKEVYPDLYPKE